MWLFLFVLKIKQLHTFPKTTKFLTVFGQNDILFNILKYNYVKQIKLFYNYEKS